MSISLSMSIGLTHGKQGGGGISPPLTTWDEARKGNVTLSEGGRLMTANANDNGVLSTSSKADGVDFYAEFILVNQSSGVIGLGNSSASLSSWSAGNANGFGYDPLFGDVYSGGSALGNSGIGTCVDGDVIGISRISGVVTFNKNGGAYGNPFAVLPTGPLFLLASVYTAKSVRIATEASQFVYGPQSGESPWN